MLNKQSNSTRQSILSIPHKRPIMDAEESQYQDLKRKYEQFVFEQNLQNVQHQRRNTAPTFLFGTNHRVFAELCQTYQPPIPPLLLPRTPPPASGVFTWNEPSVKFRAPSTSSSSIDLENHNPFGLSGGLVRGYRADAY